MFEMPLLAHKECGFDYARLGKFDQVVVTSNYAARLVACECPGMTTPPFLVVGQKSAQLLSDTGLDVASVFDDVAALKEHIIKSPNRRTIYLSGSEITTDLPDHVERVILYETIYKQGFSQNEIDILKRGVDIVPIASSNCAKTLIKLINESDSPNLLAESRFIAISFKVGELLQKQFKNVIIADSSEKLTQTIIVHAKNIDEKAGIRRK